jgi:hypothetical protein
MRFHLYFKHDGAIPHFSQEVCQWLSENYPGCWAGRGRDAPVKLGKYVSCDHSGSNHNIPFLRKVLRIHSNGLLRAYFDV